MLIVEDILDPVKSVLGTCSDEVAYSKINEAINELKNTGLWDPLVGFMDICTDSNQITLPDDVEVPLAINVGGIPADFRNKWFEFHLNGPGSECCGSCCSWNWADKGEFPTFRSIIEPSTVYASPQAAESLGSQMRVYGYQVDANGNDQWVMTADSNGVLQDGCAVDIVYGSTTASAATFRRITRVSKPVTNSFVQLTANDPGSSTGATLLGLFRPNDREPSFRRITVSGAGCDRLNVNAGTNCNCTNPTNTWVRMRFRKKFFEVSRSSDVVPLNSVTAIKMMVMAIKKYESDLLTDYAQYFEAAKAALNREQKARSGPNQIKIQLNLGYAGQRFENMI